VTREPLSARCRGEEETIGLGRQLGESFAGGELVSLEGDLGAGKTVFVRGLAAGLGIDAERIVSPSFVLAIDHEGERTGLLHVDLYRLGEGATIDDLGIEETLVEGGVVAVEWGEKLPRVLRSGAWRVVMARGAEPDERAVTVLPPAG
jgi:tRNA threonylcarbamoyladenosine biosynthesis protein TsaE